jgi:CubicO group peptidase (beta-lactamase class C family)
MRKSLIIFFHLIVLVTSSQAQSFDPILAGRLQNVIDSMRTSNNIKGISACVIYPGVGTWKGVSGVSHFGTPINSNMEFAIASNTKLFTGVLMLMLAESGLLSLEDSLHEHLPNFNNVDSSITIRQLLNHSSGLDDVTSVPGYPDSILNDPNRIYTAAELIAWAGPPIFPAGTDWNYCNTNYLLAGMIAESVTGQPYGQLLHDNILTPLQLDSTFLDVYDSVLYAIAHPWQNGFNNNSISRKSLNSAAWAAGAMYSTSGEMAQWYDALMNGQVLSPSSFQELTTFVGSGKYSMGIAETTVVNRTVWCHGGSIWGGYSSNMMYDTTTGIIICVLTNQLPAPAFQTSVQLLATMVNNPVGLAEGLIETPSFQVYPNPASDHICIEDPLKLLKEVQIFHPGGELICSYDTTEFSIASLPNGIYFMFVNTASGVYVRKVVKQ